MLSLARSRHQPLASCCVTLAPGLPHAQQMPRTSLIALSLTAMVGCGARAPAAPAAACGRSIAGALTDVQLVSSDALPFDALRACEGSYYVRVHGSGTRHFDYARSVASECDVPDADPVACPTVSVHVFGPRVLEALHARLGESNADAFGLGACANVNAPLSAWNLSNYVHDFRHVDAAIAVTREELVRWNLAEDFGVSISPIECTVLD
jgi:hypothetical protein